MIRADVVRSRSGAYRAVMPMASRGAATHPQHFLHDQLVTNSYVAKGLLRVLPVVLLGASLGGCSLPASSNEEPARAVQSDASMQKPAVPTKAPTSQPAAQATSRPAAKRDWKGKRDRQDRRRGPFTIRWVNPRDKKPPGVEHHTFHSAAMNCDVGFNIYTPPDYATSDKRYPVIYWLHGGASGGEAVGVGNARILQKAILAKQLPPVIMVFPSGGRGSFYDDSADGTIMAETAFIKELIPLIDKNYRTIADRQARAIEGFSMGGFGALKFAFKYPQLFCSVVSGAPALLDWTAASSGRRHAPERAKRMWNNDRNAFESDHPSAWLKKNTDIIRKKLRIRIFVGDQDGLKHRYIDAFHERLGELNIPHEYEVLEGVKHSRTQVYPLVGLKGFQFHADSFAKGAS